MSKIIKVFALLFFIITSLSGCISRDNSLDMYYEALPTATNLIRVDNISNNILPESVKYVFKDENGAGYSIMIQFDGFSGEKSPTTIIVGVSPDNVVEGVVCVCYGDTMPMKENYESVFVGKDLLGVESVDLVSGVTITSKAYRNAVADAVRAAEILG